MELNSVKASNKNRALYALSRINEHFFDTQFSQNLKAQRAKAIADEITEKYQNRKGKKLEIPVVTDISVKDFVKNFQQQNKPVVLKGFAKKWNCTQKWSPEFFIKNYGDHSISVMDNDDSYGNVNIEHMPIQEYMQSVIDGDTRKYLRFGNLLHMFPELLKDFEYELLMKLRGPWAFGKNAGVFIGTKGTKTSLHAAPAHNLFVQVHGVKNWVLYDCSSDPFINPNVERTTFYTTNFDHEYPDYTNFPAAQYLDYYEFDLEPGDIFFNPASFWHQVINKTPSIGVGFRWFSPKCFQTNFTQMLLFFLATNPSLFFVARNKKHYTKVLEASEKKLKVKKLKQVQ